MPIGFIFTAFDSGISGIPYAWAVIKTLVCLALIWVLKTYFGGARNTSERVMHSKGGTAGVGASIAHELASRGGQLILLTQHPLTDPFLVDYIEDLRTRTNNELITAEQVDLSSLLSIRMFATKWVDNAPPRRLDMIILCANAMTPKGAKIVLTEDGVESDFAINYLGNFHLLSILSPALRAQPPDRDVRILFGTCSSYMAGQIPEQIPAPKKISSTTKSKLVSHTPSLGYAASKLSLMTFATAFQKHLSAYSRPDKQPMNARVILVDPGWCRTPGMRRYLTIGTLWGLALYLSLWPFWWLVLKSPEQGAQSFLYAAMEAEYGRVSGGKLIKECKEVSLRKSEISDEIKQRHLWEMTEKAIEVLEKESALRRFAKKEALEKIEDTKLLDKPRENAGTSLREKQPGSRKSRKK